MGVIAVVMIPSLIVKSQEKEIIIQLKKSFNLLSDAYNLAVAQYGSPDGWQMVNYKDAEGEYNSEGGTNGASYLLPFLKTAKICGSKTGCFPNVKYKMLDGSESSILDKDERVFRIQLADGSSVEVLGENSQCKSEFGDNKFLKSVCGSIIVDVNGFKGPNQRGIDTFSFYITMYGIIPKGIQGTIGDENIVFCRKAGWQCTA